MSCSVGWSSTLTARFAGSLPRRAAVFCMVALFCSYGFGQVAQVKPAVQVTFQVMAQRYTDHFSQSDIQKIEMAAQQTLIAALNAQIPFLAFTADNQPCHLIVTLKYSDLAAPDAGPRRDTIFGVQMTMPGQNTVSDDNWPYLGWIHYYDAFSTADATSAVIALPFAKLPVDHLVERILSHIPLSATAHLVWKPPSGAMATGQVAAVVIPIPASQLCMDDDSRLALDSQFAGDFGGQPVEAVIVPQGEFHPVDPNLLPDDVGHLFGIPFRVSPADQPWSVLDSATEDKVSVKGIFVREYRPLDTGCNSVVQPSNSGLAGGGQ